MSVHRLKTAPPHFQALWEGSKTFEVRWDDRGYAVGDTLELVESDNGKESGRVVYAEVSHILQGGQFGIGEGWVVLSLTGLEAQKGPPLAVSACMARYAPRGVRYRPDGRKTPAQRPDTLADRLRSIGPRYFHFSAPIGGGVGTQSVDPSARKEHMAKGQRRRSTSKGNGDRTRQMHDQLMAEIEKLGTADGWKALLQIRSRLHHYSFRNVMTILSQRPDATMIAGFNDWVSKHKRVPQKGTAIFYWAPHTSKEVDPSTGKEEEKLGFHLTFGFDISDTKPLDPDAPELPIKRHAERLEGQPPAALWDGLTAILGKLGYRVEVTEIEGGAKGDTSPDGLVRIDSRNAPMERVAVLIHELAHVFCGHLDDMDDYQAHRGRSEVEAESVAWIAMKACGMDVERWSFEYIDGWAKGDMELIQETATKVCKVSDQLIDALDAEIGKEIEKEGVSL